MSEADKARLWVPLKPRERRVLGVLIEKQKTTPDAYPMTVLAIVTGSNQKSNRDPVTNYEQEDVEDALEDLRHKGATVLVEGLGRVPKWKHSAYDWFGLRGKPEEAAILAELLLRGPQTEGELRQRASRMDAIPDLPRLQAHLNTLSDLGLVAYLSPPGQKRGAVVCHCLYPADEAERVKTAATRQSLEGASDAGTGSASRSSESTALADELASLRSELGTLREQFAQLTEDLAALKRSLGA